MKTKVVIYVSGGNVHAVFSDDPDIDVRLIDDDNLRETLDREGREAALAEATAHLDEVPIH